VPCVAHLVVMNFGQIIRRVQIEGMHIEPSDRAQQRIGCDHPVVLGRDCLVLALVRSCCALRTSIVVRCPPAASRRTPRSATSAAAHFGLRRRERDLWFPHWRPRR